MSLSSLITQVVVAPETAPGVIPTTNGSFANDLLDPANANISTFSVTPNFNPELFTRDVVTTSLTPGKQGVGTVAGGITTTFPISVGLASGAIPPWSRLMDMAGFPTRTLTRGTITGATAWTKSGTAVKTGPIRHGELVDDGSGNTAIVVRDVHEGQPYIYIDEGTQSATMTAGTWVTQDTGITLAVGSVDTGAAYAWAPVSASARSIETDATLLGGNTLDVGDLIIGQTSGAKGRVSKAFSETTPRLVFEPIRGEFADAETIKKYDRDTDTYPDAITADADVDERFDTWASVSILANQDGRGVVFTGSRGTVTFDFPINREVTASVTTQGSWAAVGSYEILAGPARDITGPSWGGVAIGYANNENSGQVPWLAAGISFEDYAAEQAPCLKSMSLDLGVQLGARTCATAQGGIEEYTASGPRQGSGSFVAEATLEEDIEFLNPLRAGETMRFWTGWGSRANGDYFEVFMPGIQYTGATSGDDSGKLTNDMAFGLTGGVIDNLSSAAPGGNISGNPTNNEFVLIHDFTA